MDKTADLYDFLKILILFVLVLIVVVIFLVKYNDVLNESVDKGICKKSLDYLASIRIKGVDMPSDINCPTIEYSIKKGGDAKAELALLMKDAWDTFDRGRTEYFETKVEKQTFSIFYHHITFEDHTPISSTDFFDYLQRTSTTDPDSGKQVSYADYFTEYATKSQEFDKKITDDRKYDINTDVPYATVIVYTKKGEWLTWFKAGGSFVVEFVDSYITTKSLSKSGYAGIIAFVQEKAVDWDAAIMLVPFESAELNTLGCTYFPAKQEKIAQQ